MGRKRAIADATQIGRDVNVKEKPRISKTPVSEKPAANTRYSFLIENEIFLRFVVEDTGIGIPKDELESVVDLGFRASNLNGKKTYGGGFGLTKAYYVTKKYNGRFWIDSEVGKGTKIVIEIPKEVEIS